MAKSLPVFLASRADQDHCSNRASVPQLQLTEVSLIANYAVIITGRRMLGLTQKTVSRPVSLEGIAIFSNADVSIRFVPADVDTGIQFQRVDLADRPIIPATSEFAQPLHRRTAISRKGASVAMIEHIMAALAGLGIHNCVVEIDGPEPPGFDGSCRAIVDSLLSSGIADLSVPIEPLCVKQTSTVSVEERGATITAVPSTDQSFRVSYNLDYGADSPISPHSAQFLITPETFAEEIASARTFVLESEVEALRSLGYGKRLTYSDLVVYGENGVVGNKLHWPDECARHKILDCIGDLALVGRPIIGTICASRTGHETNQQLAAQLLNQGQPQQVSRSRQAA